MLIVLVPEQRDGWFRNLSAPERCEASDRRIGDHPVGSECVSRSRTWPRSRNPPRRGPARSSRWTASSARRAFPRRSRGRARRSGRRSASCRAPPSRRRPRHARLDQDRGRAMRCRGSRSGSLGNAAAETKSSQSSAAPAEPRPYSSYRATRATGAVGSKTQPAGGRRQDVSRPAPRVASPLRPTVPPARVRVAPHLLDPCQGGLMLDCRRHRRSPASLRRRRCEEARGLTSRGSPPLPSREEPPTSRVWSPRLWQFPHRCERTRRSSYLGGRMPAASSMSA